MYAATNGLTEISAENELMKQFNALYPDKHWSDGIFILMSACAPPPKLIKTHLFPDLLPEDTFKKCKVWC